MQIGRQVHLKRTIHEIAAMMEHCVILDTETTRLYGEVIDLAIIDGENGTVLFDSLIHPTSEKIEEAATAVHGIKNGDTWSYPLFKDAWPQIESLIAGRNIITYNAQFDCDRILQSARYNLTPLPSMTWLCAMEAYAAFYGEPGRYGSFKWQKLSEACEQQGVVLENAHRALADAMATYQLLKAIGEKGEIPKAPATHRGIELIDMEKGTLEL